MIIHRNGVLKITAQFTKSGDTQPKAVLSLPVQSTKDVPITNIRQNKNEVAFDVPGAPGDPKFQGKILLKGEKIEGTVMQGGTTMPFFLERKPDPVEAAKVALVGFDEVITDTMKKLEVPGVAIAVVKGDEVIYSKGFGYRDVEKQLPVTPDTLFGIGSTTKAFTTFVLGTLVEEGKLEWDAPVRQYIPWFKLSDPDATEHLTVRDLVTHRSGLPRHDLLWYNNYEESRENLVRRLAHLEPSAALREKYQYNNLMYMAAGYLAEVVTGKSWEDLVRERILNPLDMKRTTFSVGDSQKDSDFAQPYAKKETQIVKIPFRPITNIGPAGAINSSVNELACWVGIHLRNGTVRGKKLAEPATVADMRRVYMPTGELSAIPAFVPGGYSLGWVTGTYMGHERVAHNGAIDGFIAEVRFFPFDDLGIVVLANLSGTPICGLLARQVTDRVLGLKPGDGDYLAKAITDRMKNEQATKEAEQKKALLKVASTHPSHTLSEFAGEYEHPGYGKLQIRLKGDTLEAEYNHILTPLEHWHYDTFNGLKADDNTFENMKFSFQTDVEGSIAGVFVPLESAVKSIVFSKKPDIRLFDPGYLSRFVGDYELPDQVMKIRIIGASLVLHLPGESPIDLVPNLKGGFTLKQDQAYSLFFPLKESGTVTEVELRMPGGVILCKRK